MEIFLALTKIMMMGVDVYVGVYAIIEFLIYVHVVPKEENTRRNASTWFSMFI